MKQRRLLVLVVSTVAVGLTMAVHAQSDVPQTPAMPGMQPGEVLAAVNGDILTKADLEAKQIAEIRRRGQPASGEHMAKALAEVTPDALVAAVDEMLLLHRGKELGMRVTEQQVQHVLEALRKENKLESDEAFASALQKERLDLPALRQTLERQLVVNQVMNHEVVLSVTPQEVGKTAYDEKRRAESDIYIRRLRSKAIIEWKNEDMRKLWIAKTSAPPTDQKA